jgi:hypothetical protein
MKIEYGTIHRADLKKDLLTIEMEKRLTVRAGKAMVIFLGDMSIIQKERLDYFLKTL